MVEKPKIGKWTKAVAPLAGVGGFFMTIGGLEGLQNHAKAIMQNPKMPTGEELGWIASAPSIWGPAMLAVAGYVMRFVPFKYVPTIGRILETAGVAAAVGGAAAEVMFHIHNPGGRRGNPGNSRGQTTTTVWARSPTVGPREAVSTAGRRAPVLTTRSYGVGR